MRCPPVAAKQVILSDVQLYQVMIDNIDAINIKRKVIWEVYVKSGSLRHRYGCVKGIGTSMNWSIIVLTYDRKCIDVILWCLNFSAWQRLSKATSCVNCRGMHPSSILYWSQQGFLKVWYCIQLHVIPIILGGHGSIKDLLFVWTFALQAPGSEDKHALVPRSPLSQYRIGLVSFEIFFRVYNPN